MTAFRGFVVWYRVNPIYNLQPYYRDTYGYQRGDFPEAERSYDRSVSLPIYPSLSDAQVEAVIAAVRGFFGEKP